MNLVELNLMQHLCHETQKHFKDQIEQHKKKKQSHRSRERKVKKEDYDSRIDTLKRDMQRINSINDEFSLILL